MEFFAWREFRNRRQVGALSGLTPTPYQSGDDSREQGISKEGNRYVRSIAIQIAWGWLRYQPESKLARWYQKRFGHGGKRLRKIGIVALARKLLIDCWVYLETGLIPEGVELNQVRLCDRLASWIDITGWWELPVLPPGFRSGNRPLDGALPQKLLGSLERMQY